uniref:Glycerol-3-phosphate dehydrogenase n=1 Tax=Phaeomonas parva TaxID=124430 RepID=A0A7S1XVP7_9STRA|mmetsp:Transcript_3813/g.10994  ORF Transcript_3813/g.10994 Transcript_3813/m.10994 type:complete len:598 (+) Transcript_3813:206-1999(+)
MMRAASAAGAAAAAVVARGHSHCLWGGSESSEDSEHKQPVPIKCRDGTTVVPYVAPSRSKQLQRLKEDDFDVLVIGGGATGCGVALDAATRGMKTALVERADFGAGTSGRSTKLIHGGIRYLERAFWRLDYTSFELVQEALDERKHMLDAAPYMNSPLPIMIPIYQLWQVPYFWAGAKAYDVVAWLSGGANAVPMSYYISKQEAMFRFPMLKEDGLKGAIVYYDGQMNDTRMALTIALTAAQSGAAIANRVEVESLTKGGDGKLTGAVVKDVKSGREFRIKARQVINATGVFSDAVRKMDDPDAVDLMVPAGGVHIMFPDYFSPDRMGLIVPETSDGRVLFFLPWENGTLSGTTDSVTEITMAPQPTEEEANFILHESRKYLNAPVKREDVLAAWSGIRPLVRDPERLSEGTKALSRKHLVTVSDSNLVTITGGKWTTYRRMAQDAVDEALRVMGVAAGDAPKSQTRGLKLVGSDRAGVVCAGKFNSILVTLKGDFGLAHDVAKHLVRNYGTRALQVAEIVRQNKYGVTKDSTSRNDTFARRLSPRYPFLEAEVVFACEQEYAGTPIDILARRTRLAFIDSEAAKRAAPRVVIDAEP